MLKEVVESKLVSHEFYLGDNVSILENHVEDGFVDLTVTSPPYDDLRSYNGFEWNLDGVIEQLWRVTKDGGVVVWVVGDKTHKRSETGSSFRTALKFMGYGWRLHDTMIYAKTNPVPLTHNRYEQQFEYMFIFSKGKPKTFNGIRVPTKTAGSRTNRKIKAREYDKEAVRSRHEVTVTKEDKLLTNIWYYSVGTASASDKLARKHPAFFPEDLAYDHIVSWSNIGDVVLDLFGGSGTVAKMSEKTHRNSIYIDISDEYLDLAKERLLEFKNENLHEEEL